MIEIHECPLCHTNLTKEKWERVTGIWQTIKQEEEKFKKRKQELEEQAKKVSEQMKEKEKKWEKEKRDILKNAEQAALKKVESQHKKELNETEKKGMEKGKAERQKTINTLIKSSEKWAEKAQEFEKKYREALKKGKTIQGMGFDFEKDIKAKLEENFPEDEIIPKGKKGDILQIVKYKDKEISRILHECKKTDWEDNFVTTLKEAVLDREVEYGIIVTSSLKKGMGGFCGFGEKVFAINPEGLIDFVKFLRESIIKIKSLKTQEERDELMKRLWDYMDSSKFGNSINGVIDKAKELKDILDKEQRIHQRIWDTRTNYYNQISENSLEIKEKVNEIIREKKKIPVMRKQKKKETNPQL